MSMAYQIEFDGPIDVSGSDNGVQVLTARAAAPLTVRGAFLGTQVEVAALGNIEIRMQSTAAMKRVFAGGAAGRADGQIVVSGHFIIRKGPRDPKTVTVKSHSSATLAAVTVRRAAGRGALQAEARVDSAFDQLTDRKRRREDRNLTTGTGRRFDNDFSNPEAQLFADQRYAFTVVLVLEAAKFQNAGRGQATATFGSSPGEAQVSLRVVQPPKKKKRKKPPPGRKG